MNTDAASDTIADRQAISDALISYCWGLDFGDWELMRSVFTPDAHLSTTNDTVDGADAIVELMQRSRSRFARTQHVLSNIRISIDGDRATSSSYVVGFDVKAGEPEQLVRIVGTYHDELVRTGQRWLIDRRTIGRTWLDSH